jgi:hypothetical protein
LNNALPHLVQLVELPCCCQVSQHGLLTHARQPLLLHAAP